MELTPDEIRATEFAERRRGYDPEEVDRFREQAAAALEQLQARLKEAEARAPEADDELLQRTLVLAQRAAERTLGDARQAAAKVVADAQEQASAMVAEAHATATRASEQQRQLLADVSALEEARIALEADVDALAVFLDEERTRVRAVLGELDRQLQQGLRGRPATARSGRRPRVVQPPPGPGDDRASGPETQAAAVVPGADDDHDDVPEPQPADEAFFAELRDALRQHHPLGPREERVSAFAPSASPTSDRAAAAFYDQDVQAEKHPSRARWRRGDA